MSAANSEAGRLVEANRPAAGSAPAASASALPVASELPAASALHISPASVASSPAALPAASASTFTSTSTSAPIPALHTSSASSAPASTATSTSASAPAAGVVPAPTLPFTASTSTSASTAASAKSASALLTSSAPAAPAASAASAPLPPPAKSASKPAAPAASSLLASSSSVSSAPVSSAPVSSAPAASSLLASYAPAAPTPAASAPAASALHTSASASVSASASAESASMAGPVVRGSKKMALGTQVVYWNDPMSDAGAAETKTQQDILTYYGMEGLPSNKQREMLSALYHGTCQTHQTILQSAQCEPVRAILQTLAMRWLSGLITKETRSVIHSLNSSNAVGSSDAVGASDAVGSSDASGSFSASSSSSSSGALGASRLSGALDASGASGAPTSWWSRMWAPTRSIPDYYYQLVGDDIIITTDGIPSDLHADLKGLENVSYTSDLTHPVERDGRSLLMEEAVAALAHYESEDNHDSPHSRHSEDSLHPEHSLHSVEELENTHAAVQASAQAAQHELDVAHREGKEGEVAAAKDQLAAMQQRLDIIEGELLLARSTTEAAEREARNREFERNQIGETYTASMAKADAELQAARANRNAAVAEVQRMRAQVAEAAREEENAVEHSVAAVHAEEAEEVRKEARIEELQRELEEARATAQQNRSNKNAALARIQRELEEERTASAQRNAAASAAQRELEQAHQQAQAAAETAAAAATKSQQDAVAAARAEARAAAEERVAAEAEAATRQADRIRAEANENVQRLQQDLENIQNEKGRSNQKRNEALAAIQRQLEEAQAKSAQAEEHLDTTRVESERAIQEAQAAQQEAVAARQEADTTRQRAESERAAAVAARQEAETAQQRAESERAAAVAAQQEAVAEAQQAQNNVAAAHAARQEAVAEARRAQSALEEEGNRVRGIEAALQAAHAEALRAAEVAARSMNETAATRAELAKQAAAAAAKEEEIKAALNASEDRLQTREQEHQDAIAKERTIATTAHAVAQKLRSRENNTKQQVEAHIATLQREIAERNEAAAAAAAALAERNRAEMNASQILRANYERQLEEQRRATEQALKEKNEETRAEIASITDRMAHDVAARNAAIRAAEEERKRLLVEHRAELAARKEQLDATQKRITELSEAQGQLSTAHTEAIAQKNTVHAAELERQQAAAEEDLTQAYAEAMTEAGRSMLEYRSEVEAQKEALNVTIKEIEAANVELHRAQKAAERSAAAAIAEKEEAEERAQHAIAEVNATKAAAQHAVNEASRLRHSNKREALNAQEIARKATEEAATANSLAEEAKGHAHAAAESAAMAIKEAAAAKEEITAAQAATANALDAKEALTRQQTEMNQTMEHLRATLAQTAAEKESAKEAVATLEQSLKEHAAGRGRNHSAFQAREDKLSLAATRASAAVEESAQKVLALQAQLNEQAAAHESAMTKAQEDAAAALTKAQAQAQAQANAHVQEKQEKEQLQASMTVLDSKITALTVEKDAALTAQQSAEETIGELQRTIDQSTTNISVLNEKLNTLVGVHRIEIQSLISTQRQNLADATARHAAAEEAHRTTSAALETKTAALDAVTQEKEKLQSRLHEIEQQFSAISLDAASVNLPSVSRTRIHELVTELMNDHFIRWRTLLRQPAALRALDLLHAPLHISDPRYNEKKELLDCIGRHSLIIMFSPLPDEKAMKTLLGEKMYNKYVTHIKPYVNPSVNLSVNQSSTVSSSSSSSSANSSSFAMRIDILLYYLIYALRHATITNQSDEFIAINATLSNIRTFTTRHLPTNKSDSLYDKSQDNEVHLANLIKSCGVRLATEHSQDQPLPTFLYLSGKSLPGSKQPFPGNRRFQYKIDEPSHQRMMLTYDSTPHAFYKADGTEDDQKVQEHKMTYHYGPFTKIYDPTMTSKAISEDGTFINAVEDRLRKGEAVTVIGYGASGSGKTTTLVYAKHSGEAGLLARVANRLIPSETKEGFTSCKVVIYELDTDTDADPDGKCRAFLPESPHSQGITMPRVVLDKEGKAQSYLLHVANCDAAPSFSYTVEKDQLTGGRIWARSKMANMPIATTAVMSSKAAVTASSVKSSTSSTGSISARSPIKGPVSSKAATAASATSSSAAMPSVEQQPMMVLMEREIVEYIDTKRNTAPTPNNPYSSRSHVICVLTFSNKGDPKREAKGSDEQSSEQDNAVFIVCDFAGVENTFMCEDNSVKSVIGNRNLIDSMIQTMKSNIYTRLTTVSLNKPETDIQERDMVLTERVFPYFFIGDQLNPSVSTAIDSNRIIGRFKRIEDECKDMYIQVADIYKNNGKFRTLDTIDQLQQKKPRVSLRDQPVVYVPNDFYQEITPEYGHGYSTSMLKVSLKMETYNTILAIYRFYVNDDVNDDVLYFSEEEMRIISGITLGAKRTDNKLRIHQLLRILTWYIQNRVKYQLLFQSLMTLYCNSAAPTVMTKSEILAYLTDSMCSRRVKEGAFINNSLARLRSFISASVRKSLHNNTNTPPFLDECAPLQCNPHHLHCFGQGASLEEEEEDGGPLAKLIETSRNGKKNTFCIFTVVNLSRDANNPPLVPYLDIGPLLTIREALRPLIPELALTTQPGIQQISDALHLVYKGIQNVSDQSPLMQNLMQEYTRLASLIKKGGDDVSYHLEDLLQQLINHNAITTIGTIEFTDTMAKYGATQITCAPMEQNEKQNRVMERVAHIEKGLQTHTSAASHGGKTPLQKHLGRMPTRVRRKANRRTRKKRNA